MVRWFHVMAAGCANSLEAAMKVLVGVVILIVLLVVVFAAGDIVGTALVIYRIPLCTEDVALAGRGEFKNGRYDYYVCGPSFDDWHEHVP